MFRTSQTENVVLKSLRTKIVHMDTQLVDYNKQGKPAVSTRKLEIFHWYFLAAYYALIIPFKIKKREGCQVWKTKSWKFQKLLSLLIFRPLVLLELITDLAGRVRVFYANKNYRPKDYLELAKPILYFTYLVNFSWTLVIGKEKLEKLFNDVGAYSLFHLKEPSVPLSSRVSKRTTWFLTAYMLFLFVLCIVYYAHEGEFYDNFLYKTIANGRKRFFLGNLQSNISRMHVNGTHDMYDTLYSNVNILVGFADLALWLSRQWYLVFVTTFFYGVLPVTFWSASKLFQRYLSGIDNFHTESPTPNESFNTSQADMIVEKYEELKTLVASLNSVWSTGVLLFVICESLDLIVNLNPKVESKDMVHIFLYVVFLLFFIILLVMYAEGYRMNASIKLWLCKKYTREQLFVQRKHELECLERYFEVAPVGIGAIGVYEISYGFLGQLLVFCVTAFLITF